MITSADCMCFKEKYTNELTSLNILHILHMYFVIRKDFTILTQAAAKINFREIALC